MSFYRLVYLTCDGCNEELDASTPTVAEARAIARERGWSRSGAEDICDVCLSQGRADGA
jgi:hypothetical protein